MGVSFWVRFFLVLTEKHFFLSLIRKNYRADYFSCFTEGGVFGAGQNKEREARAVWEFPESKCRPLSVVSLLWGEEGEDLYGFSFTLSNNCLVVFLRCVEDVNAPI